MSTTAPHRLPDTAFPLLSELTRRLEGQRFAPAEVLDAVAVLTAAADPARADRLRPLPCEPGTLVLRLAVWALRQVDDRAVCDAWAALGDGAPLTVDSLVQQV